MGVLFIDTRGRYLVERQLYAVVAVVLNFHTKTELETPQSGAGRHPLGWPAWGSRHLATDFLWTAWIVSWKSVEEDWVQIT